MSDLQIALLFPYFPFLGLLITFAFVELIDGNNDDDDDQSGGKGIRVMEPDYSRAGA
jgi:hypothetical protein